MLTSSMPLTPSSSRWTARHSKYALSPRGRVKPPITGPQGLTVARHGTRPYLNLFSSAQDASEGLQTCDVGPSTLGAPFVYCLFGFQRGALSAGASNRSPVDRNVSH